MALNTLKCNHLTPLGLTGLRLWLRNMLDADGVFQGIVNVGAVDMTEHQSVGGPYGIRGFPTIKIFGANKQSPQDYQGICFVTL